MKIGLIGFGYWGPNLARNLSLLPDNPFDAIIDNSPKNLAKAMKTYPNLRVASTYKYLDCDAFVVATPIETHFEICKDLLSRGKHVLVQKPMAHGSAACQELIDLAEKNNCVLMVAHTFLFSPPIQRIKKDIEDKIYGELNYINSTRINLGLFQRTHNVVWDLAPHDFSIISYLYPEKPLFISAFGTSHTNSGLVDCANITIGYESNFIATVNINWLSPIKARNLILAGTKKMTVYDDMSSEKLKIYDTGVDYDENLRFSYRKGDIYTPKLDEIEPIYGECSEFINSIKENRKPKSNGEFGKEIVKMIEATCESIENKGKPIQC